MLTDRETERREAGNEGKKVRKYQEDYFRLKDGKNVLGEKKKKKNEGKWLKT